MTKADYVYNQRQILYTVYHYRYRLGWSMDELYNWVESKGFKRYLYGNTINQLRRIQDLLLVELNELNRLTNLEKEVMDDELPF